MLFDGQRPGVSPHIGTVILNEEGLTKKGPFEQRLSLDQDENPNRRQKKEIKSGINLEPAANQKILYLERAVFLVFSEEQSGNEKATQDEEQVHAGPTPTAAKLNQGRQESLEIGRMSRGMAKQHQQHGDSTQHIQLDRPHSPLAKPQG